MSQSVPNCQSPESSAPPWSQIDTVMFDMDGTLLDLHFDNHFWLQLLPDVWARSLGIDTDTAHRQLQQMYAEVQGTLSWYCLDFWAERLQLDLPALKKEVRHKILVRPNVTALLTRLRELDKRVLLVTNAHPGSLDLKLEHTGIGGYFDRVISAHALQLAKENHGFWSALMRLEHYEPTRTLLIDDNLAVLRQARREGIRFLFAIHQPDSQREPLEAAEFPQIVDFEHILPAGDRNPAQQAGAAVQSDG